ncbi:MAG: hypothetical protein JO326_15175 [Acetobacteraceae bacterium]|nr:hypothetical protein [Acetobacteraceae bacterium]
MQQGVYKGFSIGGRVRERDSADRRVITGLALNEISLVDRPANPEAVFDCWKADGADTAAPATPRPRQPIPLWDCGIAGHRHAAKAEALRCIEAPDAASPAPAGEVAAAYGDPGFQPDGRERYPLDSEAHIRAAWAYIHRPRDAAKYTPDQVDRIKQRIVVAWKEKIDPVGPPLAAHPHAKAIAGESLRKRLDDVGHLAGTILGLEWLRGSLATEVAVAGDESARLAKPRAIIDELSGFLNDRVAEKTGELLETGAGELRDTAELIVQAAGAPAGEVAELLRKTGDPRLAAFAATLAGSPRAGGELLGTALAKAFAEKAALAAMLDDIVPRLDKLTQRVEAIAQTPLPPVTIARSLAGITKRDDGTRAAGPPEDVVAALSRMSDEERTLALIKAAYANPIRPVSPGLNERGDR